MNAIGSPVIPNRTARVALAPRRTYGISIVTRITVGIAWVVLTVAVSLVMLDATFGYSGTGPAVAPQVVGPRANDGAATRVTEADTPKPGAGPAPMLEAQ